MAFSIRKSPQQEYTSDQILSLIPSYNKEDKVLIFDGDILAFKCASVCEYKYLYKNKENGDEYKAKSKKEFLTFLEENVDCGVIEDYECIFQQEAQPVSYAINTVKSCIKNIMEYLGCNKFEIYIGGSGNFRCDLPLYPRYKSSRSDQPRPLLLTPLKEYLIEHMGALRIKGVEADDIVQQRMSDTYRQGVQSILWTVDKDAKQNLDYCMNIYNPDKNTLEQLVCNESKLHLAKGQVKGSGLWFLLYQVFQGDPTDNYSLKPYFTKKFGDAGYYKFLENAVDNYEHIYKWILLTKKIIPDKIEYSDCNGVDQSLTRWEALELMFQCAYMKLSANDSTTLKSLLNRYGDFNEFY